MTPRATYRLQLTGAFTLHDAAAAAPHLARLGVSHLYLSPILAAEPGSTHGYDVVDPTRLDPERGGEEGWAALVAAARAAGLGIVLDVVPNHMSVAGEGNRLWWDVLEHGLASRHARVFDLGDPPELPILLPVLGDAVGVALEQRELALERRGPDVVLRAPARAFPVSPATVGRLLEAPALATGDERLGFVADALQALPVGPEPADLRRRERDHGVLRALLAERLAEPPIAAAVDRHLAVVSDDPGALDDVLTSQAWRLASWRTSRRELGWRRFFDIHGLAGLRMEDPDVFASTHARILELVAAGEVDGLRVDHPDGLRDPEGYAERLRAGAGASTWIVVEKILAAGEALPPSWPVQGTTGYDFLRVLDHAFVEPAGKPAIDALWREVGGEDVPFAEIARRGRLAVLDDALGSELLRLVHLLARVTAEHPRHRDHTEDALVAVVREALAAMPVYRTYVRPGRPVALADREAIDRAVTAAAQALPEVDPALPAFLGAVLAGDVPGDAAVALLCAWQQASGAVMAKGVEDTAFYVDTRFVALNEVGGDPASFGLPVDAVHAELAAAAALRPASMLAGSTHDTKRSEDVRARLIVLSEIAEEWAAEVKRWRDLAAGLRDARVDGPTELHLLQTVVGAWPIDEERVVAWLIKAVREAKAHTSWTRPDAAYEDAVTDFARAVLADPALSEAIAAFVDRIRGPGRVASLARTLVRLTAPGVPDLYQGTEVWSHTLVDPDNRRPIEVAALAGLLDRLDGASLSAVLAGGDDGLTKAHVVRTALAARAAHPEALGPGAAYRSIAVEGAAAARVLAYGRGDDELVVVVPLRVVGLPEATADARLTLPHRSRDLLTGDEVAAGEHAVVDLWRRFPVALLARAT
jgi:(1->4)-alpha-D-glucan 1-alpha-D-glucosylmutase